MQTSSQKGGSLPSHPYATIADWSYEDTKLSSVPDLRLPKRAAIDTSPLDNIFLSTPDSLPADKVRTEASRVLALLSGKWTCELLWILSEGKARLSQLRRRMPHASKKVLVEELRKLEQYGLVLRTDLSSHQIKHVEYQLEDEVRLGIGHLLESLANWGTILKGDPGA